MNENHTEREKAARETIHKLYRRTREIVRNKHQIRAEHCVDEIGDDADDEDDGPVWDLILRPKHDIAPHNHQNAEVNHNGMIQKALESDIMKKRIHRKRGVRAEQEHDPADYGADRQKGVSAALDKALAERAHEAAVQRQTAKVQGDVVIWLVGTVDDQIEHNFDDFKNPENYRADPYRFSDLGKRHPAREIKRRRDERRAREQKDEMFHAE